MRTWCYIGCDTARGRRAKTPRRGEFSVVEQGALELHHLQHFGKHIHMPSRGLPANHSGLLSKSSYGKSAMSKKAGRAGKYGMRSRRKVSLVEAFADAKSA